MTVKTNSATKKPTTKKTTKKTTTVSKQADTEYLKKGVTDFKNIINNHICNINKKKHWSIELYTDASINNFIREHNLDKVLTYVGKYHEIAIQKAVDNSYQNYLDRQDERYGTMQGKTKQQEHQERLQQEFDTMKKEFAKLNKAISKALKTN